MVFDVCFSTDSQTVFSSGSDGVRMTRLDDQNGTARLIGVHGDKSANCVGFLCSPKMPVSAGFDKKLQVLDPRSPSPAQVFALSSAVHAMDVEGDSVIVATKDQMIQKYNFSSSMSQPLKQTKKLKSPLQFQIRSIQWLPPPSGSAPNAFAVSSIGGEVILRKPHAADILVKCHRHGSDAYAVNSIAFYKQTGSFATAGSDGAVNFWHPSGQLFRDFGRTRRPIICAAFNPSGTLYAYSSGYDWSQGAAHAADYPGNGIYLHPVSGNG